MEHIAIMKKSWGLLDKIIVGTKKIESRWYKNKYPPWGSIKKGDILYFKDSGEPVTLKSKVDKVEFHSNLHYHKNKDILEKYGGSNGLGLEDIENFLQIIKNKNYCILIFFSNIEPIEPFSIDKTGYGSMSSWITIRDVNKIKLASSEDRPLQQYMTDY